MTHRPQSWNRLTPRSRVTSTQTSGPHQPPDALGCDPHPTRDQLGPDPAHTGMPIQLAVDLEDLFGELSVGALTLARPRRTPPVVTLTHHPELLAHKRDRVLFLVSPVRDRRVLHGCSFANQAATFFAKSRSILKAVFSLRSRSSSPRSVSANSLS